MTDQGTGQLFQVACLNVKFNAVANGQGADVPDLKSYTLEESISD